MTQPEMKSLITARISSLEKRLESIYKTCQINDRLCFLRPDGSLITLGYILSFGAVIVEYADNESEARLNRFEDGDQFSIEDLDEETMFQKIVFEVGPL